MGNQLYFVNGDGTLWLASGTTATQVSPSSGSFNQLSDLTAVGNQLYFTSSYFFNRRNCGSPAAPGPRN